ncbi:CheB methylesterase:MCP methyltransferase, CheR-type [uncultured Alphaproteobacteria bacterium]|uniref:histidine kinase n=1 Tax=uncultured Alphaproteobacteria bacterium TaxID=91750 RepID=A0A212ITL9_9PROT|nr:CheB methylesterase:MCP methyltransferase, CheR-type [uncultured Alphaproteobacteria bacterium]
MIARAQPVKTIGRTPEAGESGGFPVVGIGASAGGLEACRNLLSTLPADSGMAFILVLHLDPHHESMMVDLLATQTSLTVRQAADGMPIAPNCLYIIPPGTYLTVADRVLGVSAPDACHGARMPFDVLLASLAEDCAARAACVVLSGSGNDGSAGLAQVKRRSGVVIAQDPEEAGFDGMPRSAIATGMVDLVLPVAEISRALIARVRDRVLPAEQAAEPPDTAWLDEIIELLRTTTAHDFRLYKPGTLQRRIERRMGMAGIAATDRARYPELLRTTPGELNELATDLLINVTSFFRDPEVFEFLARNVVPDLVRAHAPDRPLRIWSAGCSSGEETYSLAMLFLEEIAASGSQVRLQMFASDVDPDAVALAREGVYPASIAEAVRHDRLARFFTKSGDGYRVLPELRSSVVFAVQDVLADPPFSRIDLISCRNLLIYLRPEAQERVLMLFHFALSEGGLLLLGNSETVGKIEDRFEVVSKTARVYRRSGPPAAKGGFPLIGGDIRPTLPVSPRPVAASHAIPIADFCREKVVEAYAPATVLITRDGECLYSLGPVDRYLKLAPGQPTRDVLALAREEVLGRLRAAIREATRTGARAVAGGGRISCDGETVGFRVEALPVANEGEALLLIGFVDEPVPEGTATADAGEAAGAQAAELAQELDAARAELHDALRTIETLAKEQKATAEEASSVQEEYQSTNEELMTSKEELQSLNEELTALNSRLQETLERQRVTSNDLQNVLYSTNTATIFLDSALRIRFFTPATKAVFNVIPGDIGRPLADLNSLAADEALLADARTVLDTGEPIEREIASHSGTWFIRRIMPYRTHESRVEGVVITFDDNTGRKHAADALEIARRQAQQASLAKSRFLAAASHDLRQPLQTLSLLHGLVAKTVADARGRQLVARLDETMDTISGMLDTLLDINQIETGTIRAEVVRFPINDLLLRIRDEFVFHAEAQGLSLRVVRCGLTIESDPRLLEQMIRNLLANALKYTKSGKVLLGCRRRRDHLSIEIRDTGIGIPEDELQAIFEEYHQLDNAARERSRGLGLGLAIVKRLGDLLGHRVRVSSRPGKGSSFAIEVKQNPSPVAAAAALPHPASARLPRSATILVVEDDPGVRDLIGVALRNEGHRTAIAADGVAALAMVAEGEVAPDLLLADFSLPNGLNGLQLAARLRERNAELPVVILTGDTSADTLREIARLECEHLNKPVKLESLVNAIHDNLGAARPVAAPAASPPTLIYVVDDDDRLRAGIRETFESEGLTVADFPSAEAFLAAFDPGRAACLLVDAYLPGMSGLALLRHLRETRAMPSSIMITGSGDVALAVEAMKAGALDFIEKPISSSALLESLRRSRDHVADLATTGNWRKHAQACLGRLTARQREILDMVLAGAPSKNIAADLGISQRTVENHRASIMKKFGAKSLPELARLAIAAEPGRGRP